MRQRSYREIVRGQSRYLLESKIRVTHTQERFRSIVNALNTAFAGTMTFQLVGSLAEKPASFHDADIVVYNLPVNDATIKPARGVRGRLAIRCMAMIRTTKSLPR